MGGEITFSPIILRLHISLAFHYIHCIKTLISELQKIKTTRYHTIIDTSPKFQIPVFLCNFRILPTIWCVLYREYKFHEILSNTTSLTQFPIGNQLDSLKSTANTFWGILRFKTMELLLCIKDYQTIRNQWRHVETTSNYWTEAPF